MSIKRLTVKDLKNILAQHDDDLHVVITLDSIGQFGITKEEIWVRDNTKEGVNFTHDPVSMSEIGDQDCLQIGVAPLIMKLTDYDYSVEGK